MRVKDQRGRPPLLRRCLREHLDLFDAIECSRFYTWWLGCNRRAFRLASD